MKTVLKVTDLTKTYAQTLVLKKVSFSLKPGEIVALLGKNGAGKTTLLKILTQLTSKDEGEVELCGNKKLFPEKIGVMFQEDFSLERVTVKECLELWRSYYPNSKSYAELLEIADLDTAQNTLLSKLSGGQRRRLNFALCLAGDPELVFLDEPTVGMDLASQQKFWQQIKKLRAAGKTFLITSHYLEELQSVTERFLILKTGELVFDGTLKELQQNHQAVTLRFTSPLAKEILARLPGVTQLTNEAENYTLQTNKLNELLAKLIPYLPAIENLSIEQGSLNDLFLEMTVGQPNDVSN